MNESTMQHFLRRLRDNGQDYMADHIERERLVAKFWTAGEICMISPDSESLYVESREYALKVKQLEFAIETVGTWINTFGDTRKETALREFREELESIRINTK